MEEVSEVGAELSSEEFFPAGGPVRHMLHARGAIEGSDVKAKLSCRRDGVLTKTLDDEREGSGKLLWSRWTKAVERGEEPGESLGLLGTAEASVVTPRDRLDCVLRNYS